MLGAALQNPHPGNYFGGRLRSFHSCADVTMAEVEYCQTVNCKRHSHGRAFFALLLGGAFTERHGREELRYVPGTIGFHPAGMTHGDETAVGSRPKLKTVSTSAVNTTADRNAVRVRNSSTRSLRATVHA